MNCSVLLDKMDGGFEGFAWDLRKARSDFVVWRILHGAVSELAPSLHPTPAKMTITVEDEERL